MVQADRDVRRLFGPHCLACLGRGLLLVLLSSVDLIMVSGLGAEAAAAVGVFSQPKLVLLCAPRAFSVAVTVRCAHLHGQKQQDVLAPKPETGVGGQRGRLPDHAARRVVCAGTAAACRGRAAGLPASGGAVWQTDAGQPLLYRHCLLCCRASAGDRADTHYPGL